MKKIYIILVGVLCLICTHKASAQASKDTFDYPYYISMMQDEKANFFATQRAFNLYYAKHHIDNQDNDNDVAGENEEQDGVALYKRWEYMTRKRIKPDGSRIPMEQVSRELKRYKLTHPDR